MHKKNDVAETVPLHSNRCMFHWNVLSFYAIINFTNKFHGKYLTG